MAENRINTEELVNELEAQVQPARLYHSRRTQLELQLNVEFCNEMLKRMKKEFVSGNIVVNDHLDFYSVVSRK